jgi:PAS domain S-box-containing protein
MGEVSFVLWAALAVSLAAGVWGVRYTLRWWNWRFVIPIICLFMIGTGPLIDIGQRTGFFTAEGARTVLEYRWLVITVLALVSVVAVAQVFERGQRVYTDLLASEERFRSISRVLPVGVFQADVDGRAVYANEGALEMLGISIGDAIGEGWMRSLHPADRDRVMEEWQAAALEGRDFRSEYRFVTTNGRAIWVLGHVLALKDDDGDVVGHVGAITDITERKENEIALEHARETLERRVVERTAELVHSNASLEREVANRRHAEGALADSEARLRAILDNTPSYIWVKDLAGRYVYVNEPMMYPDEIPLLRGLRGKTDTELFPPDIAAQLTTGDRNVIETGAIVEVEDTLDVPRGRRSYVTTKFPLRDAVGKVYAVGGVATDVTERTRTTQAIERVFRLSPALMCTTDANGRILMVNPACEHAFGYTPEEVIGRSYEDFIHPDDLEATRIAGRKVREDGQGLIAYENRFRAKDGTYHVLSSQLAFARDEQIFYAAGADVTDQTRQANAIRRVYSLSPLAMSRVDWDGRITLANPAYHQALGYTEQEMVGRSYRDFVHPDDLPSVEALDRELRVTEKTASFDTRMVCKDGSVRLFAWETASALSERAFYNVGRDITAQAQQMDAIRRIYRLSPVSMCTFDWTGQIIMMNPILPQSLGYTEAELLGHRAIDLLHPDDVEVVNDQFRALTTNETTLFNVEMRVRRKDGTYRVLSWDVSSSPAERRLYGVARDITDTRQVEREMAERRDEMAHLLRLQTMGEMASEIAHELNQPLTAIVAYARGASNRLRSGDVPTDELNDLMGKVATQALRAGELIRRIRAYARKAELETEPCDLNELVRNAVGLLGAGRRTKAKVRLVLDERLPRIDADAIQIEQVILNLVRNGIEAASETGEPTLTIRTDLTEGDEVRLSVTDNGPGIEDAGADHIFDPFYTTKAAGVGLGLSISRTIVEAHGGRIWAEPHNTGGSTFRFVLPFGHVSQEFAES